MGLIYHFLLSQEDICFFLRLNNDGERTERMKSMFKLTSIALGLKNQPVLHCLGVWLHRQSPHSDKSLMLCQSVLEEFVLLVPEPLDALKNIPAIAPLFAAHLMTCITELYSFDSPQTQTPVKNYSSTIITNSAKTNTYPPPTVVDLLTCWMGETDSLVDDHCRMLPAMSPVLNSTSCLANQSSTPLLGLAKWAVSFPLFAQRRDTGLRGEQFAKLHVGILECLADVNQKRSLLKTDIVSAKKLIVFVNEIQVLFDNLDVDEAECEESLDRLGQFLNCLMAANCVSGKREELVATLKNFPENKMMSLLTK